MIENVSVNYSEPMPFSFIFLLPSSEDMLTTLHSLENRNFNFMLFKAMQSEEKLPGNNLERREGQVRKSQSLTQGGSSLQQLHCSFLNDG